MPSAVLASEAEGSEGSDQDVFAISEDLVASPQHKSAGNSSLDFDGLLQTPLGLHEDLTNGCGGQLWPAGMVLTKYLLRSHRDKLENLSIVELGAGGGLVGLAIALGCKTTEPVYITDQVPMLALMEKNIELNVLQGRAKAAVYDWGSAVPTNIPTQPDILLAADCVYFEPAFPLLQQTMSDMIGENTICYFCFKKRRRADLHFMKAVKKIFDIEEVQDDPDKAIYSKENIFLYKIKRRQISPR